MWDRAGTRRNKYESDRNYRRDRLRQERSFGLYARAYECCGIEIIERFGQDILNDQGEIDRGKLGLVVFADQEKLRQLNEIVHPAVKKHIQELIATEKSLGTKIFAVEAALLIEDHYETICDEFWYIYADESIRRERLKRSRGYTDEQIDAVFASQASEETYKAHSRYVIDNSGDFAATCRQIRYLGEEDEDETM